MTIKKSICVYCGSQPGTDPAYVKAAKIVGETMAKNEIGLVYGGGVQGIMGACSRAAHDNGGKVIGIIPEFLKEREAINRAGEFCSELIVTTSMHERKHLMFEKSDAFIALPGGIGTLEEVVEILTWAQIGRHEKPVGLLNINGFWDPLFELLEHMKDQGFIHSANKLKPILIEDPSEIVTFLTR